MALSAQEPRPLIAALGPCYDSTRDLSWLLVRATAGGFLLIHGIQKVALNSIAGFAANSMARRGIEPAIAAAYMIFFLETAGAVCIMLGLFTRLFAALIFVEFLVIIFVAHWGGGFVGFPWNRQGTRVGSSSRAPRISCARRSGRSRSSAPSSPAAPPRIRARPDLAHAVSKPPPMNSRRIDVRGTWSS